MIEMKSEDVNLRNLTYWAIKFSNDLWRTKAKSELRYKNIWPSSLAKERELAFTVSQKGTMQSFNFLPI
jgi:hypothetical protein